VAEASVPAVLRVGGGVLCSILLAAGPAVTTDLEAAKALYEQARGEKDVARRIKLLQDSLSAYETYEAHYALGETLYKASRFGAARVQLAKAYEIAAHDRARARACYMVAETLLSEDKVEEALTLMRASLLLHSYPNVAERLQEIEAKRLGKPLPAAEIARALSSPDSRAFGVKPSVTLRIAFDLDSASLSPAGLEQARELGSALTGLEPRRFEIVGHTDTLGDAAHNDALSLRRAETVRDFLVRNFPIAAASLQAIGKGEREPLYPGETPRAHALNRRVEVRVGPE
jgi:outer membrane protein OmpA-like peptidoglycan-associated protein